MDGNPHSDIAALPVAELGRLMPMYIWVAPSGHIRAVGPTMAKLCEGRLLAGMRFLEVFEVRKPHQVQSMEEVIRLCGQRLHLALREAPRTALRGLVVPVEDGQGILVNLSFGIAVAEAVREHALTNADFAATDLTVELLYLTEVKAAVMEELGALNRRLQRAQQAAEAQALTDALTGLSNRRALDMELQRAVDGVARGSNGFALMQIDLDYFKTVNDTLGHAAGDLVLTEVAKKLKAETRRHDVIARVGGDEFVLILPGPIDPLTVGRIAARIIRGLEQPVMFEGQPCRISGSIGATLSQFYDQPDADRMLSDADVALYASKRQGRAQCTIYEAGLDVAEHDTGAEDRETRGVVR
ncbi:MAG: GGDEF domain-containing protein [Albidovulum sp.]|uniref:GGDEF domain-containing protein n=1 Tax=Albidovulum sp. TaxID=1872424 RepID=UPI003C97D115